MVTPLDEERRITQAALSAAGEESGFVLAGSGAIREHGFITRPTEDVDLFSVQAAQEHFALALGRIEAALQGLGYELETRRL